MVELLLDLLELGLQTRILILRDVVGDLQISKLILEVLLLHLNEVVERLCLWLLLHAEDHFTELFAFELVKLAVSWAYASNGGSLIAVVIALLSILLIEYPRN